MRRTASSVLFGLGAFLIVAAVLIKFYAYPSLATVPTNYESTTMLEAKDATVFVTSPVGPKEGVDLSIESYTVADSNADVPDGTAVWVSKSSITRGDIPDAACPTTAEPAPEDNFPGCFQQTTERGGFDAKTGAAVSNADCPGCESSTTESVSVRDDGVSENTVPTDRSGQWLKFPFDTQKKDYDQWDGSTGRAWPAVYEGTEKLDGLTVYKFVQDIPETTLEGTRDLPGSVFGSPEASVPASTVYQMKRTFYIDPVTGAPVNRVEERTQEFEFEGTRVPAFNGTVQYTPDQIKESVDTAKSKGGALAAMKLLIPGLALLLGLLAIAGGVVLHRRGRGDGTATPADDRELVNA